MSGLYVHIPFCVRKCYYCDFYSEEGPRALSLFIEGLKKEIALSADIEGRPSMISTIYLGGGTPSLLSPDQVTEILQPIFEQFAVLPEAEISMEVNPGTVVPKQLADYRKAGVNRLSVGIQSFLDEELTLLGRIHTAEEAIRTLRQTKEAGFDNIGLDLIYGLPNQTLEDWKISIEEAVRQHVKHISCYALTWSEKTVLGARIVKGDLPEPEEDVISDMYLSASRTLRENGFEHYEISNFARPGFRCIHNEAYWTGEPYLGFGPSAHSFVGDARYWNVSDLEEYLDHIDKGESPVGGRETLSDEQRKLEKIALSLRTKEGLLLDDVTINRVEVDASIQMGLADLNAGRFRLTPEGFLLADEIAVRLTS